MTTDRGLVPPETRITRDDLAAFAGVDIATGGERYLGPLRRDVETLATKVGRQTRVVLLAGAASLLLRLLLALPPGPARP